MPIPGAVFTSSSGGDIGGGKPFTQIKGGPLLVGSIPDSPGMTVPPAGILCVQTASSGVSTVNTLTTANNRGNYVYIPYSTVAWVASTGTPAFNAVGAALLWDDNAKCLFVYSPASGAWLQPHTTAGATISFSASSS